MDLIKKFNAFHDWYLMGVSADREASIVELALMFDNRKDRVRVQFKGATRCLANDFLIQNVIYEVKVLTDFQSPDYQRALHALEKSYFGKENRPNMPIASVGASLGAELFIEFDTVDVVTDLL
ncbi:MULTISPECIES: hypothetical protein [unclassified Paraburkholderia]|uniref:hypothetical protein n=1 Tax=unclassified Paraburkholderia TaxID=2615204 RepID=UPI0016222E41|nr:MULTISPECIES: hypothetical protein [unclassified Paraburkholderia]MBB5460461.1 hypothetical protein [Paraburkholderia sp. Cpub6]MBC8729738.1 hypothetical protein [Paraburkholderia sp. UCT2]